MRLGIVTPVVNLNPRFDPPEWERAGGIDDVIAVAGEAERLGYDFVGCPEHVAIPDAVAATRGGRYWDPVTTLAFVAARTSSIRLLSHVAVLGYHHPLGLVKQYGSLDEASGGRVILGVGVGSLRAEFELLGADFDQRGALADDALGAIRASFGVRAPEYHGTHFEIAGWIVEPCGIPRHLDIWVGGRSRRSLRRAIELGDGWIPFGMGLDELAVLLGDPAVAGALAERPQPLEVVLAPEPPLDPTGDPSGSRRALEAYAAVGATGLALRFRHHSRPHYVEQLGALAALADDTYG